MLCCIFVRCWSTHSPEHKFDWIIRGPIVVSVVVGSSSVYLYSIIKAYLLSTIDYAFINCIYVYNWFCFKCFRKIFFKRCAFVKNNLMFTLQIFTSKSSIVCVSDFVFCRLISYSSLTFYELYSVKWTTQRNTSPIDTGKLFQLSSNEFRFSLYS